MDCSMLFLTSRPLHMFSLLGLSFLISINSLFSDPDICTNSFFKKNIYVFIIFIWSGLVLVVAGRFLSSSSPALLLRHASPLVVACELLVVACMWDLVP